jgi:hypothetical protein
VNVVTLAENHERLPMSQPQPSPDGVRSDEQIALERAKGEVSDVLLNIEHALDRAKRAHKNVAKAGVDSNAELALAEAAADLERLRKRLFQDTYFAGDNLRLM